MTYSSDFSAWARAFAERRDRGGLTVVLDESREHADNRSARLSIIDGERGCELLVWDSGEVEYYVVDTGGVDAAHFDLGVDTDLRSLCGRFEADVVRVVLRA